LQRWAAWSGINRGILGDGDICTEEALHIRLRRHRGVSEIKGSNEEIRVKQDVIINKVPEIHQKIGGWSGMCKTLFQEPFKYARKLSILENHCG